MIFDSPKWRWTKADGPKDYGYLTNVHFSMAKRSAAATRPGNVAVPDQNLTC